MNSIKLFIDIGTYAGIGLRGNYKYSDYFNHENGKVNWGSNEWESLKRIEYGLMARTGAEIKKFDVGLSYELSLRNIAVYDNLDYKNRVLTLFVSYPVFGK